MSDLKIGVIGSGGRGVIAAHAHQPGNGSRIIAVCDQSSAVLQQNRAAYGPEVFTTSDFRSLLALDLDAVFISTPDFLHEEMAVAALLSGKAVYLEKPMAISTAGCDRILQAARISGSKLYLGHNMRHMSFVQKMKELIENGAIGNVKAIWCRHFVGNGGDYYFRDWHAEQKYTNSLLLQKGAHDIDVIHWLAGGHSKMVQGMGALTLYNENPRRAAASAVPRGRTHNPPDLRDWPPRTLTGLNATIDVEDLSMVQMQLNNGVYATYQQCHYTPDYWRNYCVIGDEGRLENEGNTEDGSRINVWNRRKAGWNSPDEVHVLPPVPSCGHGGADARIIEEFLRFVRVGGPTMTSPLAARDSVAAGCAATYSLRHGSIPVAVPELDRETRHYFNHGQTLPPPPFEEETPPPLKTNVQNPECNLAISASS